MAPYRVTISTLPKANLRPWTGRSFSLGLPMEQTSRLINRMLVKELIVQLQQVNPEATVTVWIDGDAHELHDADTLDASDCGTNVQINAKNSDEYANS